MYLSRDDILKADDLPREEVDVPEWGGKVIVRALSGKERDAFELSCTQERPVYGADGKPVSGRTETVPNLANVRAKLVARSCINPDGTRLFSDADAKLLGEHSAAALDRIFEVAQRLSRLSDADIEDLTGNSGAGPAGASTTSSPETSDAPR